MSRRGWGHPHTFAGGAIAGLALSYRPWLIFAAGIAIGAAVILAARAWRKLWHELRGLWGARGGGRGAPMRRGAPIDWQGDAGEYARIQREQRAEHWRREGQQV